jgi:Fe-S-cluster-containing dehydrogenase component
VTISRRDTLKILAAGGAVAALADAAEAREPRAAGADDVGMLFDATLCVGCRACQTACRDANGLAPDAARTGGLYDAPLDLNGTTKNVIKLATDGAASAYVKVQCMHCVDPSCVSVCMAGALHKEPNGVTAYDKSTCVGCRYCQVACPFNVPKFQWDRAIPVIQKCELCRDRKDGRTAAGPACCEVCPRGAVKYGKRAALLAEARERVRREPGKYFEDRAYGEADGGGTNVLYLSPRDVSFKALGLPRLPKVAPAEKAEAVQHGIYKLGIAPVALYAAVTWAQFRARAKEADAPPPAADPRDGGEP